MLCERCGEPIIRGSENLSLNFDAAKRLCQRCARIGLTGLVFGSTIISAKQSTPPTSSPPEPPPPLVYNMSPTAQNNTVTASPLTVNWWGHKR